MDQFYSLAPRARCILSQTRVSAIVQLDMNVIVRPDAARARSDGLIKDFASGFSRVLVERGLLDEIALRRARQAELKSGERFDIVLARLGLMSESDVAVELSDYLGLPLACSADMPLAPLWPELIPSGFVTNHRILPLSEREGRLLVAVDDPFNLDPISALGFMLDKPVDRALACPRDLELAIARLYAKPSDGASPPASTEQAGSAQEEDVRRLQDLASDAPIVRLVQDLIVRAVETQASDIHIEPREDCLEIRLRIDGVLHLVDRLAPNDRAAITSRIKIMARLDIAERRLPQDGRVTVPVRGKDIDLRVSTMPTLNGESTVLRILDRSRIPLEFASLGFAGQVLRQLTDLLEAPSGIVLVTGPTGSGKTTTLYTALSALNDGKRKIFTVEDPIEYQLAGISQVNVEPKIGLSFGTALRSILRQDPDILMAGEIRDLETAEMAVEASLTGHLVLSTVHTNSAAATIARLINLGVEDYLLASSVTGVVAQRLVRRLCTACAVPLEASRAVIDRLRRDAGHLLDLAGIDPGGHRLHRKVGCPVCRGTGYSGRLAVNELLRVDAAVADAILEKADERSIQEVAARQGMITMYQDGVVKALQGLTTVEEVLRATRVDR
jgi:general secretion pathway protein E